MAHIKNSKALKATIRERMVRIGMTNEDIEDVTGKPYEDIRLWLNSAIGGVWKKHMDQSVPKLCERLGIEIKIMVVLKPIDEVFMYEKGDQK